jgi:hypothetical protein
MPKMHSNTSSRKPKLANPNANDAAEDHHDDSGLDDPNLSRMPAFAYPLSDSSDVDLYRQGEVADQDERMRRWLTL